jgi:hypothetical protein
MPVDERSSGPQALLNACRLWERTSAKGNRYLTGRLGGLKVVILANTRPAEGDDSTHTLFLGEAAKKAPDGGRQQAPESTRQRPRRARVEMPVSDKVPF